MALGKGENSKIKSSISSVAPSDVGTILAQLKDEFGVASGPPIDLPLDISRNQLQQICETVATKIDNDEETKVIFILIFLP